MQLPVWSKRGVLAAALVLATVTAARAVEGDAGVAAELQALKSRIAELESKQNANWLTEERTAQIKGIVQDVLKDAKLRGQSADGLSVGYKDGFFIQDASENFKLVVGGYAQVRYEGSFTNATHNRTLPSRTLSSTVTGSGGSTNSSTTPSDPGDANGFDIRRARLSFTGNVFSKDLTYKFEGDFYAGTGGAFTVTDAFVAYRFNDQFKVKAGSYKVPFAKAELTSDPLTMSSERPEELSPFDPVRALGVSLYGDIIKDTLGYEVAVNDGTSTNTLRRVDTVGLTPNLDNRYGVYARVQWAGNGKISDFADESDLRIDNRNFIWLLGGAVGYESQNATNNAFPSPQTTANVNGISNRDGPGFTNYALNGDVFRGTLDWSAKYQGLSLLTAGYIQQVNANPGNTSGTSATSISTGPFGANDASFFQWGGYGQVGYFVIPQKLELIGRAGILATEGYPNIGEFYTVGANYYVFAHNLKIQSDVTYTPEAAYTDSATQLLQNTHDVVFRVQLQVKF